MTPDKAKVEAGVLLVERWILAALRKRSFFSLGEVNEAIAELLARLNERLFRKRDGSRKTLFETLDRPALKPLAGPSVPTPALLELLHVPFNLTQDCRVSQFNSPLGHHLDQIP